MVSVLDSGASALGLNPGRGLCVVFLGKTSNSHSASLAHVYKWVLTNLTLGGNPAMDKHPIQEGVEILLVASCYSNQDKLWPDGPLACMQTLPCLPHGEGKGSHSHIGWGTCRKF